MVNLNLDTMSPATHKGNEAVLDVCDEDMEDMKELYKEDGSIAVVL